MLNRVKSRDRFRGDASFRTYLFTIARNELYAAFRKCRRDRAIFDPAIHSVLDMGTSPSSAIGKKDEQRLMLQAMYRLPVELQIVLELFYWEDMSSDELGTILDIPVGTVKSRLRRAKASLRGKMEDVGSRKEVLARTQDDFDGWAASIRDCFVSGTT